MIIFEKVRSTVYPERVRIDEYSVWVSEDIKEVEVEFDGDVYVEYEFDQKRYSKDEYIKLIDEKSTELESQLTDTQLALCEIYEGVIQYGKDLRRIDTKGTQNH